MDDVKQARDISGFRNLDRLILDHVRNGDPQQGAKLLVKHYGPEIIGTCISRTGDTMLGEDAAQDALVRGIRGLVDYRGEAGLRPWLHRIAANRCVDLMRTQQVRYRRSASESIIQHVAAQTEALPSEIAESAQHQRLRVEAVRDAMADVKEPDRTWLELHYTHGVSYEQIADEEALSRAAVKQRIWRAVKKVRARLAKRGDSI